MDKPDILTKSICRITALAIADKADETAKLMDEKKMDVPGQTALRGFAEAIRSCNWDKET